ncbi:hypothetical protein IPA_04485 [Ignicoccus pacificus DSM 13166]|uniref:AAA+ ATPase domain-containing protein n=1 Tax=Ignicoccus pacificus DSM 13166 TaxID=940294 RepID=A0A977PKV3_9CREN|nr:hypothetical protein IPA_04485 [Ignicoccus pacificus DSM 13166]
MVEHTKATAKREGVVLESPLNKVKVVAFGIDNSISAEEEAAIMPLLSKVFDVAVDSLIDDETWIYKLKVPFEINPVMTKALGRPLALYVVPSLVDSLGINIASSVYLNHKSRMRRMLTVVGVKNPNDPFVTLTIVFSTKDDNLTKDEVQKILKKERSRTKKYVNEALRLMGFNSQVKTVRTPLIVRIARVFSSDEIKVRVEDGSDLIDVTLKLREPEWDLSSFPSSLVEDLRTLVIEPILENKPYSIRGMIVAGPPGMGKSVLVEAMAKEMKKKVVDIEPSTYRSMWYGHTEKILRSVFEHLKRRNDLVILIDDAEFLMSRNMVTHEGYVSEISTFLKIFQERERPFIALTANYPEVIDQALLRPGRVDLLVVMGYPDKEFRRKIVENTLGRYKIKVNDDIKEDIVRLTKWFSAAEMDAFIRMAIMKGKGTITHDSLLWARRRFSIDETERARMQERTLWYLQKVQGMVVAYVKRPEEV